MLVTVAVVGRSDPYLQWSEQQPSIKPTAVVVAKKGRVGDAATSAYGLCRGIADCAYGLRLYTSGGQHLIPQPSPRPQLLCWPHGRRGRHHNPCWTDWGRLGPHLYTGVWPVIVIEGNGPAPVRDEGMTQRLESTLFCWDSRDGATRTCTPGFGQSPDQRERCCSPRRRPWLLSWKQERCGQRYTADVDVALN